MSRTVWSASVAALFCLAAVAEAQTLYVKVRNKDKEEIGFVQDDKMSGLRLRGKAEEIPAENILETVFELATMPGWSTFSIDVYRPTRKAEEDAEKAPRADRAKSLKAVEEKYREVLRKVDAKELAFRRHMDYKLVYLQAHIGLLDESAQLARFEATEKLAKFKSKHGECWQATQAALLLAELQISAGEWAKAEETCKALAAEKVSPALKQELLLKTAQIYIRAGKIADAQTRVKALASEVPAGSPAALRLALLDAECQAALNNIDGAAVIANKVLAESKDNDMRAVAYNTLGVCYFKAGKMQDARWPFLWVDVVYNHNKHEHAKALYYLAQIFRELNEIDRAQECLDQLRSAQFAGTDYQIRAELAKKGS